MPGFAEVFDENGAKALVKEMISLIGDNPDREGLQDTPARVVRSWKELYSGYREDPMVHAKVFKTAFDQMVVMNGIDYFSMCEHHMLPFYGTVSIAMIPAEQERLELGQGMTVERSAAPPKVLGASKFARIVNVYSRRLQMQERMTQQIAKAIEQATKPKGVVVVAKGFHLCMMARGVRQSNCEMTTSEVLGVFRDDPKARAEAFALIHD